MSSLSPRLLAYLEHIVSNSGPASSDVLGWGGGAAAPEPWSPEVLSPLGGAPSPDFQPQATTPQPPVQGMAGPSAGSGWGGEAPPEPPSYDAPELTPQAETPFWQSALMQVLGNAPMMMPQRGAYGKYPSGFDRFAGVALPLLAHGVAGGIEGGIRSRQAAVNAKNAAATDEARMKYGAEAIGYPAKVAAWSSIKTNQATNRKDFLKSMIPPPADPNDELVPTPAKMRSASGLDKATRGQIATWTKEGSSGGFGGMNAIALTPEAQAMLAQQLATTGTMPALGMGAGGRIAVANAAARIYPGANIGGAKADFQSNQASLVNLQKMSDGVRAFENTAIKNSNVMLNVMAKVPDSGAAWFNKPMRSVSLSGLGSADVAAFNAARRTVIPEFARILSNPTMAGQLSDDARHEIEGMVRGDYTLGQMMATIDILKQDAVNRRDSYDQQLAEVRDRIKGETKSVGGPAMLTYKGKKYEIPADKVDATLAMPGWSK